MYKLCLWHSGLTCWTCFKNNLHAGPPQFKFIKRHSVELCLEWVLGFLGNAALALLRTCACVFAAFIFLPFCPDIIHHQMDVGPLPITHTWPQTHLWMPRCSTLLMEPCRTQHRPSVLSPGCYLKTTVAYKARQISTHKDAPQIPSMCQHGKHVTANHSVWKSRFLKCLHFWCHRV